MAHEAPARARPRRAEVPPTRTTRLAEAEATNRVVAFSRLLDVPVLIVHVSGREAVQTIRAAQTLGARVFAETTPQYLFLRATDADRPGLEGAKWCCSPPPRDEASPAGAVAGTQGRQLPGALRPRALPLRRVGQAAEGRQDHFQGNGERRPGPAGTPAAALLGRRRQEADLAAGVRR